MRLIYKVVDSNNKKRMFSFTKTYKLLNGCVLECFEMKELKNNEEVSLVKMSFNFCTYPVDYLFQEMLEEAGIEIKWLKFVR